MKLEELFENVNMNAEERRLFNEILQLVRQKEDGMFENVVNEIDRKINEVMNNDSK